MLKKCSDEGFSAVSSAFLSVAVGGARRCSIAGALVTAVRVAAVTSAVSALRSIFLWRFCGNILNHQGATCKKNLLAARTECRKTEALPVSTVRQKQAAVGTAVPHCCDCLPFSNVRKSTGLQCRWKILLTTATEFGTKGKLLIPVPHE